MKAKEICIPQERRYLLLEICDDDASIIGVYATKDEARINLKDQLYRNLKEYASDEGQTDELASVWKDIEDAIADGKSCDCEIFEEPIGIDDTSAYSHVDVKYPTTWHIFEIDIADSVESRLCRNLIERTIATMLRRNALMETAQRHRSDARDRIEADIVEMKIDSNLEILFALLEDSGLPVTTHKSANGFFISLEVNGTEYSI